MSTIITAKKLNTELVNLEQKVQTMRSLLICLIGQDKEGEYRPEFVRKILGAIGEKAEYSFKDEKTFLSQLKKYA